MDIISTRWLEGFLRTWPNELIVISTINFLIESAPTQRCSIGKNFESSGNCSKIYELVAAEESLHEKTRLNQEKKIQKEMQFVERFRSKASKAAAVQSRLKRLEKMDALQKLDNETELDFAFTEASFEADKMLECRNLSFSYLDTLNPLFPILNSC